MNQQLPLDIQLPDAASFANFYNVGNTTLLAHLQQSLTNNSGQCFYLWGNNGEGCTHLLQAMCRQATTEHKTASYIALTQQNIMTPDVLEGLAQIDLICLDDIEQICGDAKWETAIFNLYNQCQETQAVFLIAGKQLPTNLSIALADLKSRVAGSVVYHVQALDDEGKLRALQLRAKNRGLELSTATAQFLLHRHKRDMTSLFSTLAILDKASLAQQRRLTIPFIKTVLQWS